jgi:hypothetical protein
VSFMDDAVPGFNYHDDMAFLREKYA